VHALLAWVHLDEAQNALDVAVVLVAEEVVTVSGGHVSSAQEDLNPSGEC
jgi:hypothetical protein